MADAPQLERPGVEVIQQFVAVSATVLRPSLPACIVGPCKQVVEAIDDAGQLVSEALVSVPARLSSPFVDDPHEYVGVDGASLILIVNNGAPKTISFPAAAVTPAKLADVIRTARIAGVTAHVEETDGLQRLVIETTSKGDNSSLRIGTGTSPSIATAFGWTVGYTAAGASGYDNALGLRLGPSDMPDPRNNSADLKVDYSSIRVFVSPGGGSPREVSRTESLVQGAMTAVSVFDDGDGDAVSPYLDFTGANFGAAPTAAIATGVTELSDADFAAVVQNKTLRMSIDGDAYQTLVFPADTDDSAKIIAAINGLWPGVASLATDALVLGSPTAEGGYESSIRIDKTASATALLTALGLTGAGAPFETSDVVRGGAYKPQVGDEVWLDGLRAGVITEIPATPTNRLRLDVEQLLSFTAASWSIRAKGLNNSEATAQRPGSELVVNANTGSIWIKPGLFQTSGGGDVKAKGLSVYVAYDALRLDLTPAKKASDFNLFRVGELTELEKKVAPIDTQNPLALGLYFAMLNAPGIEMTACGVDDANAGAPEGTVEAYARSFEYLESKEIYNIVPLTHSPDVGAIGATHVKVMSEPENSLERVIILNPLRPTRKSSTLIASGPRANLNGPPSDVVQTGLANLQAALAAAGKPGPTYTEDDNVYLMFEGDSSHYLVQEVNGGAVTINNGPLANNTDGYYVEGGGSAIFDELIVDRPFTIAIRGAALSNLTDEAAAYGDLGRGYRDKRVIVVAPDTAKATLGGLETAIPGYYLAAALAGRKAGKLPSQPLTEDSLAGFSGVVGSQERYSEPQLRIMSGGGLWIFYQEAEGQPPRTRQQLTTDVSTLLTRESSITDALDYAAKTLRITFKNFIGRFNITTGLVEALNLVCDGVSDFFIQNNIFEVFSVVEIIQDTNNPDGLSIVADVATLKPLNKIRVTLRVT